MNNKHNPRNITNDKPTNFREAIKHLFISLNKYKVVILISFILAAIGSLLSIITPNKLSNLTDYITKGLVPNINENTIQEIMTSEYISNEDKFIFNEFIKNISSKDKSINTYNEIDKLPNDIKNIIKPKMDLIAIRNIALLLLIIYLASSLFNYLQGIIMAGVTTNFAKNLRKDISKKINKLPLKYFDNHSIGDTISRVTNDIDTVSQSMNQSLGTIIGAITLFVGSIIMMFYTNWIMALTAIISSLIGFVIMSIILSKSQKYFISRQEKLGLINGHIEEVYSGHIAVKAYNGEQDALKKFNKYNKMVFENDRKSQFLSGMMQPLMVFIGNFSYVAICVVGAMLVINGSITFGVIIAFTVYARLFTSPLSSIAQSLTSLQSALAATERVFNFLDEEEMNDETSIKNELIKSKVAGNITFEHVRFGYNKDKIIIKDFNVEVKPGQKIAIVGPTGAGKTTLVNLLMKFYEINSGDIKIDGISIKELKRENIHSLFTMVLQDTWLFKGTIKENIIYNKEHITNKEIENVSEIVGIDHFIKTLSNNYESVINDSESISSGQKQLLTIARGMMDKTPFLILDEATSSVDTRTEELVQKAMDKLMNGRTSFIIAHRLSTIKNADLILVMDHGNIVEQGNHQELMTKNGFYANLYNAQFKK